MAIGPEDRAREEIDRLLEAAGWVVQDPDQINHFAGPGIAVREAALRTGFADYLLMVGVFLEQERDEVGRQETERVLGLIAETAEDEEMRKLATELIDTVLLTEQKELREE